jgi:hypothetical protein
VSCAQSEEPKGKQPNHLKADYSDGFDQSDALAVTAKCNIPAGILWVESNGEVRFQPTSDTDYDASVCVLNELKASGTTKFGFVGNEKYVATGEN